MQAIRTYAKDMEEILDEAAKHKRIVNMKTLKEVTHFYPSVYDSGKI
ncbi:MAG: hypothetical protein CM15mV25_1240 [uncultured marine virus]|nr:MAG: hypothetical protein CM15mV25_1240 [uncultured marine virus]